MYQLQASGQYRPCDSSPSLPGVRAADVARFVELGRTTDKIRWARELRDWVHTELTTRGRREEPPAEELA